MPKRNAEFFVLDMLLAVDRINRYAGDFVLVNEFVCDEAACNIILRDLAIIGEAMNHVLQDGRVTHLIKREWREVVDFRNVVIHEYFGLSYDEIFRVIKKDIPVLEKELLKFIQKLEDKRAIGTAIADVQVEMRAMKRAESLRYLTKIKRLLKKEH